MDFAKLFAQLRVVVDHTVGYQSGAVIFIVNWLLAVSRVHNGQPDMTQDPLVKLGMHSVTIWSTVTQRVNHT